MATVQLNIVSASCNRLSGICESGLIGTWPLLSCNCAVACSIITDYKNGSQQLSGARVGGGHHHGSDAEAVRASWEECTTETR